MSPTSARMEAKHTGGISEEIHKVQEVRGSVKEVEGKPKVIEETGNVWQSIRCCCLWQCGRDQKPISVSKSNHLASPKTVLPETSQGSGFTSFQNKHFTPTQWSSVWKKSSGKKKTWEDNLKFLTISLSKEIAYIWNVCFPLVDIKQTYP